MIDSRQGPGPRNAVGAAQPLARGTARSAVARGSRRDGVDRGPVLMRRFTGARP